MNKKNMDNCFHSEIQCSSPPEISNAKVITYSQATYRVGDIATYQCRKGYKFQAEFDSITCESDGEWSDSYPICVGKSGSFIMNFVQLVRLLRVLPNKQWILKLMFTKKNLQFRRQNAFLLKGYFIQFKFSD